MADNNEDLNIISGISFDFSQIKKEKKQSVIFAKDIQNTDHKTQIVGGDSDDFQYEPPAIVIEKTNDAISKIIVKCPCGRCSELVCEYED